MTELNAKSETDASNTDISGANVAENCPMSGLNDAIRGLTGMAKRAYDRDHAGAWVTVGGTANAITLTYSVGPAAYVTGEKFTFAATASNTGATTVNVQGLGAKNVFAGGAALVGGEIQSGQIRTVSYDGTQLQLASAQPRQPTRTVQTSGSGTYTTPAGATRLNIRLIGAGGGGAGSGTGPGLAATGGNTTFGTLTGSGGVGAIAGAGGSGGTASGGDINIAGGVGSQINSSLTVSAGGQGASSPFCGGGTSGAGSTGGSANANTGAGGGGAGAGGVAPAGGGGGAGGYVEKLIVSPTATYSYGVGASGAGGSGGTSGAPGGAGGSGIIIIDEYYN